jgi:hypothetical protein
MEKTTVKFLEDSIKDLIPNDIGSQLKFKNKVEQAKEMEKKKLEQFYNHGKWAIIEHGHGESFEDYYNQTFNK